MNCYECSLTFLTPRSVDSISFFHVGNALITRPVKLNLTQGLHIRACSRVVELVNGFQGTVKIRYGDRSADASSMFDLLQLAAIPGADLVIEGQGDGADLVLDRLEGFFSKTSESTE